MKKLFILLFIFFVTVNSNELPQKSLWDLIVKMEQIFLSVEYNGRRLNVWREEIHGYDRFFVTPLCVLDTGSVKCIEDKYSSENPNVFSFYVQLWDSDAAGIVQLALKQKGIDVQQSDIIPLPMQMVRLTINRNEITSEITINDRWLSYQGQPNGILFDLWVRKKAFCNAMINDVKTDPKTFLDRTKLYFEFTMFVGQNDFRIVNITGSTIMKSNFFAKLVNEYSDKNGIVYLQSDDVNKLAREIYRSTAIHDQQTEGYITSKDENEIIKELLNEIKGEQILSSQLSTEDWKSVFWSDVFSKPDLQTTYLNDILTFDADKEQFKYEEINDQKFIGDLQNQYGRETIEAKQGEAGFIYGLIGGKIGWSKSIQ